jgi:serine/threonine-protein kinase
VARTYGRYKVIEEAGHGSMGVVYKAHDPVIGRTVAVKVIRDLPWLAPAEAEAYRARFRLEAQAAGPLQHPNIVTLYDVGDGYLVMEFLEGQSLAGLLRARQRLTLGQVLHYCGQIAFALDFAHQRGVVHRDLKPANVMVLPGGDVKIMDFGVARLRADETTIEGLIVGSPAYMAPEQLAGHRADARSDQFSLGVIVYELLTGTRPFGGTSETAVMDRVRSAPVPSVLAVSPSLPPEYEDILWRALDKDAAARFASAGEFVGALHLRRLDETDLAALLLRPDDPAAEVPQRTAREPRAEPAVAPAFVLVEEPPPVSPTTADGPSVPRSSPVPPGPTPAARAASPAVTRSPAASRAPLAGVAAGAALLGILGLAVARRGALPAGPSPPPSPSPRVAPTASAVAPRSVAVSDPESAARTVLIVSSLPPGARVFLGGVDRGTTPVVVHDPPPGQTLVRVEKEGFSAAHRLARIVAGRPAGLDVRLQPEDAAALTVDVMSLPDDATLSVDGTVVGKTNALKLPLTPGFHVLEVQKDGFHTWAQEIQVGPETDRVIVRLERREP